MKLKKRKNISGFTLIEILIYVAVLSVVVVFIAGSFISINQGRSRSESISEVNANVRFALERIGQDVRYSSEVLDPLNTTASSTSLKLKLFGAEINYCVVNGVLKREQGSLCSGSSESVNNNSVLVDQLSFSRIENFNPVLNKTFVSIRVDLDMSYNSAIPEFQYFESKQSTFSLR